MSDCVFCKIVAGGLPSNKVYEDEKTLAFLNINPVNPGHVLVIPKEHFTNLEEIPDVLLAEVIKTVKKVGLAVKSGLPSFGYNVCVNNDPVAGQIIPHIHFHIIPRKTEDGLRLWSHKTYREGEAVEIAEKLRKHT